MEGSTPRTIVNLEGQNTTPSVVGLMEDGTRIVGMPAKRQVRNTRFTALSPSPILYFWCGISCFAFILTSCCFLPNHVLMEYVVIGCAWIK